MSNCNNYTINAGSTRVFNVDLTADGGLPAGTTTAGISLSARDEYADEDISADVVPAGSVMQIAGNVVTIKITADQPRSRVRVSMSYTNPVATPGIQRWEFTFA